MWRGEWLGGRGPPPCRGGHPAREAAKPKGADRNQQICVVWALESVQFQVGNSFSSSRNEKGFPAFICQMRDESDCFLSTFIAGYSFTASPYCLFRNKRKGPTEGIMLSWKERWDDVQQRLRERRKCEEGLIC